MDFIPPENHFEYLASPVIKRHVEAAGFWLSNEQINAVYDELMSDIDNNGTLKSQSQSLKIPALRKVGDEDVDVDIYVEVKHWFDSPNEEFERVIHQLIDFSICESVFIV